MKTKYILWLIPLLALLLGQTAAASTPAGLAIAASFSPENAIGLHASHFKETDGRLTLDQAIAAYGSGEFSAGNSNILNFGIGAKPVWIHFSVDNTTPRPLQRRLSVETAWLDRVDIHFRHNGKTVAAHHLGDISYTGHGV